MDLPTRSHDDIGQHASCNGAHTTTPASTASNTSNVKSTSTPASTAATTENAAAVGTAARQPHGAVAALDVRIDVKGAYIVDDEEEQSEVDIAPQQHSNGSVRDAQSQRRRRRRRRRSSDFQWTRSAGLVDGEAAEDEYADEGDEDVQRDSRDIRLPHQRSIVSHMAVDIGGSLIKVCYWSFEHGSQDTGGRLNFRKFPTDRIDTCIEFMRHLAIKHRLRRLSSGGGINSDSDSSPTQDDESAIADDDGQLYVVATGGGAYKFHDKITEALGVEVMREDEMECLIIGLDFFISQIPSEVYTFGDARDTHRFVPAGSFKHPYLLVNIGSGVSIVKVSGPREFTRVGGTSLGGGTLWGLLSLLTGARNFEDMLHMAERGDNTAVDMLVGDIYGSDYGKIGLKSTTIASSFGKVYRMKRQAERDAEDSGGMANNSENGSEAHVLNGLHEHAGSSSSSSSSKPTPAMETHADTTASSANFNDDPAPSTANQHISFRPEDVSRSLLYAISNNIGQLAYLHAEKHACEHIYFGGSFIGGHWQTMATLSYAIDFWSRGCKQAYFLRHEGYLGAVGAFLRRQPVHWGARRGSVEGLFPLGSAAAAGAAVGTGSTRPGVRMDKPA